MTTDPALLDPLLEPVLDSVPEPSLDTVLEPALDSVFQLPPALSPLGQLGDVAAVRQVALGRSGETAAGAVLSGSASVGAGLAIDQAWDQEGWRSGTQDAEDVGIEVADVGDLDIDLGGDRGAGW